MEGREAAAASTRWAAAEATTAAAADTEAVPVQRAANRTKHRTLEMPQACV